MEVPCHHGCRTMRAAGPWRLHLLLAAAPTVQAAAMALHPLCSAYGGGSSSSAATAQQPLQPHPASQGAHCGSCCSLTPRSWLAGLRRTQPGTSSCSPSGLRCAGGEHLASLLSVLCRAAWSRYPVPSRHPVTVVTLPLARPHLHSNHHHPHPHPAGLQVGATVECFLQCQQPSQGSWWQADQVRPHCH
jgi:hypothetical protein